ncbi:MAG TPA: pyridoxal phosphate-dependent aminotransferase family protein, partial [Fibrella sp.]
IGQTTSPVTPVLLQNDGGIVAATAMVRELREVYGIFCSIVTYPVVPKEIIMLRVIPTAAHSLDDVAYTLTVFSEIVEKLKNGYYVQKNPVGMDEMAQVAVTESAAE